MRISEHLPAPSGAARRKTVASLAAVALACAWFFQDSINQYWLQTYHEESPLQGLSSVSAWATGARAKTWADDAAQSARAALRAPFDKLGGAYNALTVNESAIGAEGGAATGEETGFEASAEIGPNDASPESDGEETETWAAGGPADGADAKGALQTADAGLPNEPEATEQSKAAALAAKDAGLGGNAGEKTADGPIASSKAGPNAEGKLATGTAGNWAKLWDLPPDLPFGVDKDAYYDELKGEKSWTLAKAARAAAAAESGVVLGSGVASSSGGASLSAASAAAKLEAADAGAGADGDEPDGADAGADGKKSGKKAAAAKAKSDSRSTAAKNGSLSVEAGRKGLRNGAGELELRPGDEVFFVGDSLMQGVAPHAQRALSQKWKIKSVNLSKQSTGLTYPSFFDWPATARRTLDANPNIKHIVVFLGANDPWDMRDRKSGKMIPFKSDKWNAVYLARIKSIAMDAHRRGVSVTWLQAPNMRRDKLNDGVQYLNALYAAAMRQSGERYVLTNDLLGMGSGASFVSSDNKGKGGAPRRLRTADGVHFTITGQKLLANRILSYFSFIPPKKDGEGEKQTMLAANGDPAGIDVGESGAERPKAKPKDNAKVQAQAQAKSPDQPKTADAGAGDAPNLSKAQRIEPQAADLAETEGAGRALGPSARGQDEAHGAKIARSGDEMSPGGAASARSGGDDWAEGRTVTAQELAAESRNRGVAKARALANESAPSRPMARPAPIKSLVQARAEKEAREAQAAGSAGGEARKPAPLGQTGSSGRAAPARPLGSMGSMGSMGSAGSMGSMGSAGSMRSTGSAGSMGSMGSMGSVGSTESGAMGTMGEPRREGAGAASKAGRSMGSMDEREPRAAPAGASLGSMGSP